MSWPKSLSSARRGRPLRFVLVGLANTGVGIAVIYLSKFALGFGDIAANVSGYGFGLLLGFALNATWTFDYRGRTVAAGVRFMLAFLTAYAANLIAVWYLIDRAAVNGYVAQAAGVLPYTVCLYLLCKSFVFREVGNRPGAAAHGQG